MFCLFWFAFCYGSPTALGPPLASAGSSAGSGREGDARLRPAATDLSALWGPSQRPSQRGAGNTSVSARTTASQRWSGRWGPAGDPLGPAGNSIDSGGKRWIQRYIRQWRPAFRARGGSFFAQFLAVVPPLASAGNLHVSIAGNPRPRPAPPPPVGALEGGGPGAGSSGGVRTSAPTGGGVGTSVGIGLRSWLETCGNLRQVHFSVRVRFPLPGF